jgi:colicin import membrane protein
MQRRRTFARAFACLLAVLAVGGLTACSSGSGSSGKPTPAGSGEEASEHAEESAQKREEQAEIDRNRELLSQIEASKREQASEAASKRRERAAEQKAKKREEASSLAATKVEQEAEAKVKKREAAARQQEEANRASRSRALEAEHKQRLTENGHHSPESPTGAAP